MPIFYKAMIKPFKFIKSTENILTRKPWAWYLWFDKRYFHCADKTTVSGEITNNYYNIIVY